MSHIFGGALLVDTALKRHHQLNTNTRQLSDRSFPAAAAAAAAATLEVSFCCW